MKATKEAILAIKAPEPFTRDVEILGMTVTVEGIKKYIERQDLQAKIEGTNDLAKQGLLKITVDDDTFVPAEHDIMAAVWASICVRDPELTVNEWLEFAHAPQGSLALQNILMQCFICSRLVEDKPNGIADALDESKEAQKNDPLAVPSADSV
jgi:hypothetical protein